MAALVETMAYVSNEENGRFVPWHGLGTACDHAMTSEEALKLGGLDWDVVPHPVFTENGIKIPNYVANTRSSDDSVLGIVTDRYKIVQNKDAFRFTDEIVGGDVRYETVGSLRNGRTIFLLAKMPKQNILGDDIDPYLCFTNTHDGTGAVRCLLTPVRVVCNNTLNLALNTAKRAWSCKHTGRIEDKLAEATETLGLANKYMTELATAADVLAHTKISDDEIYKIVEDMFPTKTEDSDRAQANMQKAKQEFMIAYYMPDIKQFRNTQWGVANAMADFVAHASPNRKTATYAERNFERVVFGHPMLDAVMQKMGATV